MIHELIWPMPRLGVRLPVVSHEYEGKRHEGVDIMYRWIAGDPPLPPRTALGRNGKPVFHVPEHVPILAIGDGAVVYAKRADNGWRTRIALFSGMHVLDLHMTCIFVRAGERVKQGQPLGICGGDPTDRPHHLVHDHHEHRVLAPEGVKGDGWGRITVDPGIALATAPIIDV